MYSPSLHQNLYQKSINCFSDYIPINMIPIVLNEEDIDLANEEIFNHKDFEKSDTEIETYESIEELTYPQEYEKGGIFILDDLNEQEKKDPRVQVTFKRSRHKISSIFIMSQDSYELSKKTVRANGSIFIIFPIQTISEMYLYQDKASIDMTFDEFKFLTSGCWDKNYQPLSIDMTKDKITGRYRL